MNDETPIAADVRHPLRLASGSPRRRELLEGCGWMLQIVSEATAERLVPGIALADQVQRLAAEKLAASATAHPLNPGQWALAADTLLELDGAALGKPTDADAAVAMLSRLSGREHRVHTGVAMRRAATPRQARVDSVFVTTTVVAFRTLARDEIEAYVALGESLDKAGSYSLQAGAARFVREVRGSVSGVIGLPLAEVDAVFERHGLPPRRSG